MTKKIMIFWGVLLGSLFLFTAAKEEPKGTITYIEGKAWRVKGNKENPLKLRSRVKSGIRIKTGEASRVEIQYPEGHMLRIGEKSEVVLGDLQGKMKVNLEKGKVWSNLLKLQANSSYEVETHLATAAVRGTVFDVYSDDSTARIGLSQGGVDVARAQAEASGWAPPKEVSGPKEISESDWIKLEPGNFIEFSWDGRYQMGKLDSLKSEEWRKFNESRDSTSGIVH